MISFMRPGRSPFADAKVLLISILPNFFESFFEENFELFQIRFIINYLQRNFFLNFSPPAYKDSQLSPQNRTTRLGASKNVVAMKAL
jgi:hypothetical protein